jgi:hypothetical protein
MNMALMHENGNPSCVSQETVEKLAKNVLTNMSNEELKDDEKDVLCKMVIKGKASALVNILQNVLTTYYRSDSTYTKGFDTNLKMTFMIEEIKK